MISRLPRLLFIYVLTLSFIYTPLLQAESLSLPSADLIAPQVVHESITEPAATGSSQKITAKVTDNVGVQSVTLFYRTVGAKDYKRKPMLNQGNDIYAATLDADEIREPGIEYYIQATDTAGNNLLHGYSFSPLVISVAAGAARVAAAPAAAPAPVSKPAKEVKVEQKEESSNKWLWIGLGALVVAAAAGGGGGDSGPSTATLTITTTEHTP
jgi:hypothetical protein